MTVCMTSWLLVGLCAALPGPTDAAGPPPSPLGGASADSWLMSRLGSLVRELEREQARDAEDLRKEAFRRHVNGLFAALSDPRLPQDQRQQAVEQLVEIGPNALPILLEHLGTSSVQERIALNDVVPRFGHLAVPELVNLLDSPDIVARRWAAFLLGEIADPAALQPLLPLIESDDWHMRLYVAHALGRIGDPRGGPALVALLGDTNPNVRRNAAIGLQEVAYPEAAAALGQALSDARSYYGARNAAARALLRAGPDGAQELLRALTDARPEVRHAALQALGYCQDERVVPELIEALTSEDWADRAFAAAALGRLGDERALQPLRTALPKERNPLARARIGAAYRMVTRKARHPGPAQ